MTLMPPANEHYCFPRTTPLFVTVCECTAGRRGPDRSLAPTAARLCGLSAQLKQPLPWLFLLYSRLSGHPYFLCGRPCSVRLFCRFIWWHWWKRGLPLTARWMPQVTSFCCDKIHWDAGTAQAKGGGQGEQLVHLFRLYEQTMALSELVTCSYLFHVCFAASSGGLSCWYKTLTQTPTHTLRERKIQVQLWRLYWL